MRLNNALEFCSGKPKGKQAAGKARGWPRERRLKQSARMRAAKIWRKATGPRTPAGKAKSAQNATTHGRFNAGWQALRKAFTLYFRFLKWARLVFKMARMNPGVNPLSLSAVRKAAPKIEKLPEKLVGAPLSLRANASYSHGYQC